MNCTCLCCRALTVANEVAPPAPDVRDQQEIERLRKALQTIRDQYGKVCEEYELCHHDACNSSAGAWFEADQALAPAAPAEQAE